MKKLAFLSIGDLSAMDDVGDVSGYLADDELAFEPLRNRGFDVATVSWLQTEIDWAEYLAVIVRSTWDYTKHSSYKFSSKSNPKQA